MFLSIFLICPNLLAGVVLLVPDTGGVGEGVIAEAQAKLRQGDIESARQTLQSLLSTEDSSHPELVLADMLFQNGYGKEARATLERFSTINAPRVDTFYAFGKLAIEEKRWFDAWVHAKLAERVAMPTNWTPKYQETVRAQLQLLMLASHAGRGDWAQVKSLAESLVTGDKVPDEFLSYAGEAQFHLGNIPGALEHYQRLAAQQPSFPTPELVVAKLYNAANDQVQAEAFFQKAVAVNDVEKQHTARLEYARWQLWQGKPEGVSDLLTFQTAHDDIRTEQQYLLAMAARMEKRLPEARTILDKLLQASPDSFPARNQLALVLIESPGLADQQLARQIAEENSQRFGNLADTWSTLGWIQLKAGDLDSAERSLSTATKAGTISRDTAFYISVLRAEQAAKLRAAAEQSSGPFFYRSENIPSGL
ncbi:MAG: tetratricopeptide repeat protein [Planctomycetales bacterium]|nr:tetratricopeptide repeat protein [Planctomycetales bacterium]